MSSASFISRVFSRPPRRGKRPRDDYNAALLGRTRDTDPPEPVLAAEPVSREPPIADEPTTIGGGLRHVRQARGLSLDDIAAETRVRRQHLEALENMELHKLPSRPFVIGYIRAYARALDLDEELAVAKFKLDAPSEDEALPTPIGVDDEGDPRRGLFITAGVAVLAAIVIWNIAQRAISAGGDRNAATAVETVDADIPPPAGPIVLGEPLPPPVEATVPEPYVTPGLENFDPQAAALAKAAAERQVAATTTPPRPFVPRGEIYGVPADQPHVTLQAVRAVTLIIKPQGGPIHDIRNLKEGEAYRAPLQAGIMVDVSMPSSVEVFVGGMSKGRLQASVTPVSQLARLP